MKANRVRVKSKDLQTPKIRSEFFVKLFSLLKFDPEIIYEGFEFYIKDTVSGIEFSAGLNGFGPGYFCSENSTESISIINEFDEEVFSENSILLDCSLEYVHDFGKTILSCSAGEINELDIEDE